MERYLIGIAIYLILVFAWIIWEIKKTPVTKENTKIYCETPLKECEISHRKIGGVYCKIKCPHKGKNGKDENGTWINCKLYDED